MQRFRWQWCHGKKDMLKTIIFFAFIVATALCACTKKDSEEVGDTIEGVWVKGSHIGDTLRFYKKNGKNVVAYNMSFNTLMPAPTEREYLLKDGKFSLQLLDRSNRFHPIESFKWKEVNKEFEVEGIELFPFMSSMRTYFTYRRIQ